MASSGHVTTGDRQAVVGTCDHRRCCVGGAGIVVASWPDYRECATTIDSLVGRNPFLSRRHADHERLLVVGPVEVVPARAAVARRTGCTRRASERCGEQPGGARPIATAVEGARRRGLQLPPPESNGEAFLSFGPAAAADYARALLDEQADLTING